MLDDIQPISDPLQWERERQNRPASINLRGSARFWMTVEQLSGLRVACNGAPEFTSITIQLTDEIGLRLYTERVDITADMVGDIMTPFIEYEFVALAPQDASE